MTKLSRENINLFNEDVMSLYNTWPSPVVIVSDGPYGVKGYPGDLESSDYLPEWYEPHIVQWSKSATPQTTLWFWNTEIGWAKIHPILEKHGWEFKSCNIWDKGKGHIAGNVNTTTISRFPVVTEVCVQYVKRPSFLINDEHYSMQEWLIHEWGRTKIPFSRTNEICGVKDAATRKYFTKSNLWYMIPAESFGKIAEYANLHGDKNGKPYFSIDGKNILTSSEWQNYKSKFYCPFGVTNVWSLPQLKGKERLTVKGRAVHLNQKPMELINRIVSSSSDENDVIWDPFGGLFTTAISCHRLKRIIYSAEIDFDVYKHGIDRLEKELEN